jgi:sugar phosphate isomerase/epimerase
VKIDLFLALFHDRPLDEALQAAKAAGCQAVEIGTTGPHDRNIRVAIEPHPGFVVYNTATMLRLCAAAGATIGVNVDPSHLFWQQIDPCASARALTGTIFHVHAKDTGFDERRLVLDGVLETRRETSERAWSFHSVGDGHPVAFWRDLVAALGDAGYNGALSIEQEDPYRSPEGPRTRHRNASGRPRPPGVVSALARGSPPTRARVAVRR